MKTLTVKQQAVLQYLQEHDGCTAPEIDREVFPRQRRTARDVLNELYVMGLIGRQVGLLHGEAARWYAESTVTA